ncbi:MAG: response regulator transcription factor [Candidatus Hydrogenedentes bacterium]|nr:response regulator transcription factor [Candidatus Hydrogenedentota bacterium]
MTRILIIDDDQTLTKLAASHLSRAGFEVFAHPTMNGGLERTKSINPDIILLDVMLGDGLGFQLCRDIRKDPLVYKAGIIFESSVGGKREIAYALEQGADSFLSKPYTLEQLVAQLQAVQRVRQNANLNDPVTDFMGLDYLKRRVNHLLFREEPFALCSIVIANLRAHRKTGGEDAVAYARRLTATLLRRTLEYTHEHTGELCDCGNGHFMAVVGRDDYQSFLKLVQSDFKYGVSEPSIRRLEELALWRNGGTSAPRSALELSVDTAATHTDHHEYTSANHMLHAIDHLLHKHEREREKSEKQAKRPVGHDKWID